MATVAPRPRLRSGTVFRKIPGRDETYVMIRDAEGKFYKFEGWEYDLLLLLDGTRDLEQLSWDLQKLHPERHTDMQWVADYMEGLRQINLLERTEQERHLIMMGKIKALRKRSFYDAENSTLMQVQIPLFDPDQLMNRIIRWTRWVWSPWFVAAWSVIFVAVLGFLVYHWDLYWAALWKLWDVTEKTAWDWVVLFVLGFGISIFHELGHGFTCKNYGGEVHKIGFMLFYLEPAFYCSVDDSYLFPKQSHRIYAALGGPYFEMMLCSVALPLWLWTPAEWWIHEAALITVLFTGISGIVFNINPLIKLDGYYALMDWVDVPDLREESFRYVQRWFKKHVLRLEVPDHPVSRRRRRIFVTYGVFAGLYTGLIYLVIFIILPGWFVGWFGPLGYLIFFGLAGFLLRKKIVEGGRFLRYLWLDKRDLIRSRRNLILTGLVLLLLVVLLAGVRSPTRIDGWFTIEPGLRAVIRAPAGSVVRAIEVSEGTAVEQGQVLAKLESHELAAERALAQADLNRLLLEAAAAHRWADAATERARREEGREARARLRMLEDRIERLALASPIAGVVSTPYLEEMVGRYLREGESFCRVDRLDTVRLAVVLSEREIEEIEMATPVRLRLESYPGRTLRSQVLSLASLARPPQGAEEEALDLVRRANRIRVLVEVENDERLLRPGMSGQAQFLTRPRSLMGKVWWRFHRWASTLVW